MSLLRVKDLHVEFDTYGGIVKAVRGVSFEVRKGKTLAIVGESGCGKSVSVQALMGLIPSPPGRITSGSAILGGREILGLRGKAAQAVRGKEVGMIFQDPMTSLNPTMTIGDQVSETVVAHERCGRAQARKMAVDLLTAVHIPDPIKQIDRYPFQLSGGMKQRVMIAMAIACNPSVLIADEPTTALDVTIQAQILALLRDIQKKNQMSIILITHDLGVVAKMADDVAVMYAGQIVESGTVDDIFYKSKHPYTQGLRSAMPDGSEGTRTKLVPIEGSPPDLFHPPIGCGYYARCPQAMKVCEMRNPSLTSVQENHFSRCWLEHDYAKNYDHSRNKRT
jgi:oligopeptide/dipeptide ABC transporter ATP-binding protein